MHILSTILVLLIKVYQKTIEFVVRCLRNVSMNKIINSFYQKVYKSKIKRLVSPYKKNIKNNTITILKYDGIGDFILFLDAAKGLRNFYANKKIILSCPISVREIDGEKICREVRRNDANYVVDPSFLLSKQEYEKIIDEENISIIYEDYIFGYFVNPFKDDIFPLQDEIEKLAKDCKCRLIITAIQKAEKSFSNNEKISPSPLEWLQLIRKAKYVITNSFHGVAYSIIFRKQFLLIPQDGSMSNQNCRYLNLLEKLELTNRIYTYKHSIKTQLEENINWEQVATEENNFIAISKAFLEQQIHQMV